MNKKILITAFVLMFVAGASATITSADSLTYNSNSQFFNGEVFNIQFSADDSTDTVSVFFDGNELDNSVDGEGDVKQGSLDIESDSVESKAVYGFRDTGKISIRQWDAVKDYLPKSSLNFGGGDWEDYVMSSEFVNNQCSDQIGYVSYKDELNGLTLDTAVYCVSEGQQMAQVAEIESNPRAQFNTEWAVSNGEESETTVISNGDTGSGTVHKFGDDVLIKWAGTIGTGKNSPIPTDELVAYSNNGGFKIISRENYDLYTTNVNDMGGEIDRWASGKLDESDVEAILNGQANQAYSTHPNSEFTDARFLGQGFTSGSMELDITNLAYPQFDIFVNACESGGDTSCNAFLEVNRPVGEPNILSTSSSKFSELNTGEIDVTFENSGGSEGSFTSRLKQCSTGFTFTGVSESVNLNPGESTSFSHPIAFDSQSYDKKEVTGSCTVEVEETSSGTSDTADVSVTGIQQNECTPGNTYIRTEDGQDKVYECNEDGLGQTLVKTCSADEVAKIQGAEYQCVDENEPPTFGECETNILGFGVPNPVCQINNFIDNITEKLSNTLFIVDLAFTGIAGLFALGYGFVNGRKFVGDPKIAAAGSVVFAALVMFGVYALISSLIAKILLIVFGVGFVYIKGLIPGV